MSDESDAGGESDASERLQEAATEAAEELEQAQSEYDTPPEVSSAEESAILDYAETAADALADGASDTTTEMHAAMLADAAKYYNKSMVKGAIQDAVEDREDEGKRPFDDLLREKLQEVVIMRSTDTKQGATFRWVFPECNIITKNGKDGRGHYNWSNFRDLYFSESGIDAAKPNKAVRGGEEWRDFVVDLIDDRGEVVEHEGPRTVAVRALKNKIRNSTGYGTAEDMVNYGGVRCVVPEYDGPALPEWWDNASELAYAWDADDDEPRPVPETVTEIHVPQSVVKSVADNEEVGTRALQTELHGRGYTLDRLGKSVSERAYVNGNETTYWALSPDLAVPRVYEPSANSATMQAMDEQLSSPSADNQNSREAATDGGTADETGSSPNLDGLDDVPGGDDE